MKKAMKRMTAALLSVAALCICTVTASAEDRYDPVMKTSHYWYSNHIGGGAPGSLDTVDHFVMPYNIRGYNGECTSLICDDPHGYGVTISCYDCDYEIRNNSHEMTWNYKTSQWWFVTEKTNDIRVRYKVVSYGFCSSSRGTVTLG